MPKQLTDIEDAIGKTIAKATYSHSYNEWMAIVFTDESYLVVRTPDDSYLDFDGYLDDDRKLFVGLLSQEEWARKKAEKDAADAKSFEARDRAEYERLKAKFEAGGPT